MGVKRDQNGFGLRLEGNVRQRGGSTRSSGCRSRFGNSANRLIKDDMLRADARLIPRQLNRAADDIFKLTNIAGPCVRFER